MQSERHEAPGEGVTSVGDGAGPRRCRTARRMVTARAGAPGVSTAVAVPSTIRLYPPVSLGGHSRVTWQQCTASALSQWLGGGEAVSLWPAASQPTVTVPQCGRRSTVTVTRKGSVGQWDISSLSRSSATADFGATSGLYPRTTRRSASREEIAVVLVNPS